LRACTASSPGSTKNRPLPWSAEEDAWGAARGDSSSSLPRNLTLLAGAADNTEDDGRGRACGTFFLQNLPPRVTSHPATETRKAEAREGDRRQKAGRIVYQKGSETQMIRGLTTTCHQ
jgi:hypothetical protein